MHVKQSINVKEKKSPTLLPLLHAIVKNVKRTEKYQSNSQLGLHTT